MITFDDLEDEVNDLDEDIFMNLLISLSPETNFVQVVLIRTETDKDKIKRFNQYQKEIKRKWNAKFIEEDFKTSEEQMLFNSKLVIDFFKNFCK